MGRQRLDHRIEVALEGFLQLVEGEADAFIYGNNDSLSAMASRTLRSCANDLTFHLRKRAWGELPTIIPRRLVYHWAYYRGHKLGEHRQRRHDRDVSVGQSAVLSRYEA